MITLKTLPEATAQQVFDQVATHLLTQNKSCSSPTGSCFYRNSEGLKCAAGCLIADDEYRQALEGSPWDVLARAEIVPSRHAELIHRLQNIHDSFKPALWQRELYAAARYFGLTTNILDDNRTSI